MTAQEIQQQIQIWERKLDGLKQKDWDARKSREEAEDALNKVKNASQKTEAAVQDAMSKIRQRVAQILGKTKFKTRYEAKTQEILCGSDTKAAMSEYSESISALTRKYLDLDSKIEDYQRNIQEAKQNLDDLRRQLNIVSQEEGDQP